MDCGKKIYNPKTNRCIQNTAQNRRRIASSATKPTKKKERIPTTRDITSGMKVKSSDGIRRLELMSDRALRIGQWLVKNYDLLSYYIGRYSDPLGDMNVQGMPKVMREVRYSIRGAYNKSMKALNDARLKVDRENGDREKKEMLARYEEILVLLRFIHQVIMKMIDDTNKYLNSTKKYLSVYRRETSNVSEDEMVSWEFEPLHFVPGKR